MYVIAYVDDEMGMMFNHRRCSRDRVLNDHIMEYIKDAPLYMNAYSSKLFTQYEDRIVVSEDFLNEAPDNAYCFVENVEVMPYQEEIEGIILCHWNRLYPSDFKFDLDVNKEPFTLVETIEFEGSSHDDITMEVYNRNAVNEEVTSMLS